MGRDVLSVYGVFFLFAAVLNLLSEWRRRVQQRHRLQPQQGLQPQHGLQPQQGLQPQRVQPQHDLQPQDRVQPQDHVQQQNRVQLPDHDQQRRLTMRVKYFTYLGITALVLGSAAIHPMAFAVIVAAILLTCLYELLNATSGLHRLGMILGALQIGASLLDGGRFFVPCLAVTATILLLAPLFANSLEETLRAARQTLVVLIYIPFLGSHLLLLAHQDNFFGHMAFFYMLILVSDCMAMLGGHLWGRRRPWSVSPNKTLEGSIVSLLSVLVTAFFLRSALPEQGLIGVLAIALAIGLMAQLGDLVASSFKRTAGVKDYGTWLPTFGGMLDRFDSFIFAAPAFYFSMSFLSEAF